MVPSPLARMQLAPRHRRAYIVESLYGDQTSFLIGGLAVVAAAAYTATRTGDALVGAVSAGIAVLVLVRLAAFRLFLSRHGSAVTRPKLWKRAYYALAVFHLLLIGTWTALVHLRSTDEFSQTLSVFVSLGFLIGAQGRNFSSLSLVRCQLLACIVPMVIGFTTLSSTRAIVFGLFLVAFYFAALQTARRTRGMLHDAVTASEENWRLAHTDLLTDLPNAACLREAARRMIEQGEDFALLIIDLDNFKRVNDAVGTLAGDQFLRQMGERIVAAVEPTTLIARGGGDEFLVLHPASGVLSQEALAQRIVDELAEPAVVQGATLRNSCSIGIARHPRDGLSYDKVSHHADMALFEAKAGGGRRFKVFATGTPDRAAERLEIENGLRFALDQGLLELHYQPIVENRTYRIVGCEGLIRWNHPTRGFVSPAEFLDVAEDAGLMDRLTDQTLETGCAAAASWPRDIAISINLSPGQLCRNDLLSTISDCLSRTGLSPERLELEITENMILDRRRDVLETLDRIRDLGVRLSLDDFGTGYSNLGQISLLPISKIKLDKSFLGDFGVDRRRTAVLRGAVQFIAPLGLEIVLEGVEAPEHVSFAAEETGISLLQGYAFHRPLPAVQIHDLLHGRDYAQEPKAASGSSVIPLHRQSGAIRH